MGKWIGNDRVFDVIVVSQVSSRVSSSMRSSWKAFRTIPHFFRRPKLPIVHQPVPGVGQTSGTLVNWKHFLGKLFLLSPLNSNPYMQSLFTLL